MNAFSWLGDPANWSGSTGVPTRILEHLQYTGLAVLLAAVIAIPIGAFVGHTGRGGFMIVGVSNGLRALPELGLLDAVGHRLDHAQLDRHQQDIFQCL
ncbi:hypothetical protein ACFQ1S_43590, partial [Kibdelosporangium lantanae]